MVDVMYTHVYLSILGVYADLAQRGRQVAHVDAALAVEVEALKDPRQPLLVLGR